MPNGSHILIAEDHDTIPCPRRIHTDEVFGRDSLKNDSIRHHRRFGSDSSTLRRVLHFLDMIPRKSLPQPEGREKKKWEIVTSEH